MLTACINKYGAGGNNAIQFVKEQFPEVAQNAESIEVTGVDSVLCDIGLIFGVNSIYNALDQYHNGEITIQEARAVRDSVIHDGVDVEDSWRFGSIVTDSLRNLKKYDGQWRLAYTITATMKSKTTKTFRILMDNDNITPRCTEKEFSQKLYDLYRKTDIEILPD